METNSRASTGSNNALAELQLKEVENYQTVDTHFLIAARRAGARIPPAPNPCRSCARAGAR